MRTLRNSIRLVGIALIVLVAFLFSVERRGQRLSVALRRLGPAFIKFGQALSTRSDLIGDAVADDLSELRDDLPSFSSRRARAIIEEELDAPIASLFASFDDVPVAAASIAQVHKATTTEGKNVAVKILRPNIEKAFARDVDLFFWLADIIDRYIPSWHRMKAPKVVKTFSETVFFELDLRFEAAAATELAENMKRHNAGLRVPAVDWTRTSRRVLVTEWIDGIPLGDVEAIHASGIDTTMILTKAARSLFAQVFMDGFFHADLHPGNLFLDKNGDVVAVDFGIMGRLDWNSRIYMAEILRGFLTEDYQHVAQMHFKAGYVPADKSVEAFTQACMAVAKPIVGKPLNEISVAKLLGQMFKIAAEFEMETQPQLLLLQKTMMVTEGVGRMLNPNLNMWELARPIIEDWAADQFGPAGKVKHVARQGQEMLERLPSMVAQAETALKLLSDEKGIKLHPHTVRQINKGRRATQIHWIVLGWAALGVMAVILSGA